MSFHYRLYGFDVETNAPLPNLLEMAAPVHTNEPLHIHLGERFGTAPVDSNTTGGVRLYMTNPGAHAWIDYFASAHAYRFYYDEGIHFVIDEQGRNLWGIWDHSLSVQYLAPFLLGPIFGFVLRLRGVIPLHASSAVIGGKAIAFVGGHGAGKSTIAAALAKTGYFILSDDVTPLREVRDTFGLLPAYPHLRLWPASVRLLFGRENALPRIVPRADILEKCFLNLDHAGFHFQTESTPLRRIYLLEPRSPEVDIARTDPLDLLEAFPLFVANTYMNYALDRPMRAHEFETLGRLLRRVSIRRLVLGTTPDCLTNLGAFLEADLRTSEHEYSLHLVDS